MATNSILARLLIKISGDTAELNKSMAGTQNQIRSFVSDINSIGKALGVSLGAFAAFQAVKSVINTMAEFEHTMSEVKAITQATGDEFDALEKDALRLGSATKFTASEVGSLQVAYGRLGFTTKEILAATEATLDLAAATGEDLAKSADVAGSTVRGFGLKAKDTQRVVDVMASSFNKTALGLDNFTESMKYVAPIAAAANATVEETTALLGVLADAGIRGSSAGTALRKIFGDLAKDGRPLQERLDELGKKGIGLADAYDEVGRTAQTALLVLTKNTDKTKELTAAFKGASGEAAAMARIMQDDLTGDVTKLTSAFEGLILKAKETSFLRNATQGLTAFINSLSGTPDLDEGLRQLVVSIKNESEPAIEAFIAKLSEVRKEIGKPIDTGIVNQLAEKYDLTSEQANKLFSSILEVNKALSFQEGVIKEFKGFAEKNGFTDMSLAAEQFKQHLYELIVAEQISIDKSKEADAALGGNAFASAIEESKERIALTRRQIQIINEFVSTQGEAEKSTEQVAVAQEKVNKGLEYYRNILKGLNEEFDKTDQNDKTKLRNLSAQISGTEQLIARLEKLKSIGDIEPVLKPLTGAGLVGPQVNAVKDALSGTLLDTAGIFEQVSARFEAALAKLATSSKDTTEKVKEQFIDFRNVVGGAIGGVASAFGSAIGGGEKFGKALLGTLANIMVQLGGMLITAGLGVEAFKKSLSSLNGAVAIAAGVALVAIGSAIGARIRNLGSSAGASSSASSSADSVARVNNNATLLDRINFAPIDVRIEGTQLRGVLRNTDRRDQVTGG